MNSICVNDDQAEGQGDVVEHGHHGAQAELQLEAEPDVGEHQQQGDAQGHEAAAQQLAGHLGRRPPPAA